MNYNFTIQILDIFLQEIHLIYFIPPIHIFAIAMFKLLPSVYVIASFFHHEAILYVINQINTNTNFFNYSTLRNQYFCHL